MLRINHVLVMVVISFGQHVKTSNINFSIITPDPSNQTIDQIIQVLTKVNNNKPKVVQAKIQETVIYACNGKNSITIRGLIPTYN
jgi:lipoate-protein ligase A